MLFQLIAYFPIHVLYLPSRLVFWESKPANLASGVGVRPLLMSRCVTPVTVRLSRFAVRAGSHTTRPPLPRPSRLTGLEYMKFSTFYVCSFPIIPGFYFNILIFSVRKSQTHTNS